MTIQLNQKNAPFRFLNGYKARAMPKGIALILHFIEHQLNKDFENTITS